MPAPAERPSTIRLKKVGDVLHVTAVDADGVELATFAGGDPLEMVREAVAAIDPELGLRLGADPHTIVKRLLAKRDG